MWARLLAVLAGVWLMAAPSLFGYGETAAMVHYVLGPIAAALAAISFWGVTGSLRWAGLPIGLQLIAGAFEEERLLSTAYAYEQTTEWHLRKPVDHEWNER